MLAQTGLRFCRQSRRQKQRGYLALELLFSLLLGSTALIVLLGTLGSTLAGLSRMREELLLENARRHITLQLEKTVAFGSTQVVIKGNKISCVSLTGNKKLLIYQEKQKLLQKTTTGSGTGVNPLSLEDVQVRDWQAKARGEKQAAVTFRLCGQARELQVTQELYCYNGEVIGDE